MEFKEKIAQITHPPLLAAESEAVSTAYPTSRSTFVASNVMDVPRATMLFMLRTVNNAFCTERSPLKELPPVLGIYSANFCHELNTAVERDDVAGVKAALDKGADVH